MGTALGIVKDEKHGGRHQKKRKNSKINLTKLALVCRDALIALSFRETKLPTCESIAVQYRTRIDKLGRYFMWDGIERKSVGTEMKQKPIRNQSELNHN